MAQISLTLPDNSIRHYGAGITAAEVAADIASSLAKKAISATVNGAHFDLAWPIETDATIAIHTMKDEVQANEPVSYTHLRAHETPEHLVCRLLLEKKKKKRKKKKKKIKK